MSEKRVSKSALILIFLIVFIDLLGFGIIIPILPQCARDFGASPSLVGFLLMSYSLAQFFMTPFWGRLSDKMGRRPILLVSLAASTLGYLIWGFAGSLLMLFVSRVVAGLGNANIAVAQAYISDVTSVENRARGMGMIGAAFGLGFTLGPAIGGALSQFGFHSVGFAAAACSFVALVLAVLKLPEPESRSKAGEERYGLEPAFYWQTLSNPLLSTSLLIFFIATFAFANMETTVALLAADWYGFGKTEISWLFTFIGFVMVMVQGGLIGRLSKKCSEAKLIGAGAVIVSAGLLLTVLLRSVPGLYAAMALLAIGISLLNPANQSLTSKLSDSKNVGGVLGVGQSLSTLGRVLGPVAGGEAFEHLGVAYPYYLAALLMLVVFALSFMLPKVQSSQSDKGSSEPAKAGT